MTHSSEGWDPSDGLGGAWHELGGGDLMEQDLMEQAEDTVPAMDDSPDGEERVRDFLTRHGGPGGPPSAGLIDPTQGWSEIYAADGYALRCDWSRTGSREAMNFTELPPAAASRDRGVP